MSATAFWQASPCSGRALGGASVLKRCPKKVWCSEEVILQYSATLCDVGCGGGCGAPWRADKRGSLQGCFDDGTRRVGISGIYPSGTCEVCRELYELNGDAPPCATCPRPTELTKRNAEAWAIFSDLDMFGRDLNKQWRAAAESALRINLWGMWGQH